MNNQLIKKEKLSIFDKMKKFIKRLFIKENNQIKEIENIEDMKNNTLKEDLKVDISFINEKEKATLY